MNRDLMLDRIQGARKKWDVIVIGGGATGLGTAVEAASRGYSTLLLEQSDFAKGTSSRSTKLAHGGVRYLKEGNVSLVLEALRERGLLMRNAPHLVHNQSFIVPTYDWWEGPFYGLGLKLYDVLAGRLGLGPSRRLSRQETLARIPTLEQKGLRGGVIYHDGQFDDARLAISLARTLVDLGGVAVNYMQVVGLLRVKGLVFGVEARDLESGRDHAVRGRVVINATGVYCDAVRRMDDAGAPPVVSPSQGVHIVLDRSFQPGESAVMVPHTDDGRVLFAVPWHDRVVVGTTDTPVDEIPLEPRPLHGEVEFLLTHAARYLTKDPRPRDVLSVFAGLRPLVRVAETRETAALSRDHTVLVSSSGLVTITGGKWTTYRKMGQDAVDEAVAVAGLTERPSRTRDLRLHGGEESAPATPGRSRAGAGRTPKGGAGKGRAARPGAEAPWEVYGSEARAVKDLAREDPAWREPLHPRLPYRAAQVVWAARHEMARTVEDVLARRTRALLLDARASIEAAPRVADLMARTLGRDASWRRAQVAAYRALAAGYLLTGERPPGGGRRRRA
ncbi:MAG TPA: glycerol-3-phosphate dehydrogenase/oxidase [Candidatus Polarisedimenticolia bacterium]|nr:glycerol-3-phosphate dehydrogenase/oxidase [Candidatus Polarisedimenticolia bacterium]